MPVLLTQFSIARWPSGRLAGKRHSIHLERSRAAGFVLRFLGSGEACSDYLSLLCPSGHELEVATALADWLDRAARKPALACDRWDLLEMTGVDALQSAPRLLADCLRE